MRDKKESGGFGIQVVAGALAAATAALLGSTIGVAGTVVGAGIASVISTVGAALYLRSIQRTRSSVRLVRSRWTGADLPNENETEADAGQGRGPEPDRPARRRWPAVVAASVLAFALGMLAITGWEAVRGEQLSGGQGTTIGRLVRPAPGPAQRPDPAPTTPAQPDATSTVPVTPSTPSGPPTTSTPPTTGSTTTPPPTTTTPPSLTTGPTQPSPSEVG